MSTSKKTHILHTLSVKLGCCRRPKLSSVFSPTPRRPHHRHPNSSSSAAWDTTTTATFSSSSTTPPPCSSDDTGSMRAVQGFGRIGGESVAVEKDSDDPYHDFRRSMLQMILEREIYSRDDLKELLNCFLQLNSPYYHGVIVRAFTEIWNGVYSSDVHVHANNWFSGDY
ncbi:hypothetical protein CASFOL_032253 [Castilleja foliolosa]|uniref:Transcription repressor n=1 Tax=Castilleja foliolosa TaxID=1961234 RepID=A0ABD3C1K9_9LAMI